MNRLLGSFMSSGITESRMYCNQIVSRLKTCPLKFFLKMTKIFFTESLLDISNLDSNIRNVFSRAIVVLINCFQPTDVIVCMRYKMYIQHSILSKINEKVFSMKLLIFILVIQYYLTNFDFISWITFGFGHES